MRKQKLQLIGVLVFLVAVLLSFLLLRVWNRREDEAKKGETVSLLALDETKVTGLVVSSGKDIRYQVIRDGDNWVIPAAFVKDASGADSGDETDGAADVTAKADSVKQMLDAVVNLEGTQPIHNVTSLAQYGLEQPSMTIENVIAGEAKPHVIEIGDLSTGASMYYARVDGGGDVYLITTLVKSLFDVTVQSLVGEGE